MEISSALSASQTDCVARMGATNSSYCSTMPTSSGWQMARIVETVVCSKSSSRQMFNLIVAVGSRDQSDAPQPSRACRPGMYPRQIALML